MKKAVRLMQAKIDMLKSEFVDTEVLKDANCCIESRTNIIKNPKFHQWQTH